MKPAFSLLSAVTVSGEALRAASHALGTGGVPQPPCSAAGRDHGDAPHPAEGDKTSVFQDVEMRKNTQWMGVGEVNSENFRIGQPECLIHASSVDHRALRFSW